MKTLLIMRLPCPYLSGDVEWTGERERHVAYRHPELLPAHRERIAETLAEPDQVWRDDDYPNTRLFSRWFDDLLGGKNVVVAVVSSGSPAGRHWIVTAFVTRKTPKGDLEWSRP